MPKSERFTPLAVLTVSLCLVGVAWHFAALHFGGSPGERGVGPSGFWRGTDYLAPGAIAIALAGFTLTAVAYSLVKSLASNYRRVRLSGDLKDSQIGFLSRGAESLARRERCCHEQKAATHLELERANASLVQLSSIAAHDLRAPLRRMDAFVGILREDYAERLDSDGLDILARVEKAAARMHLMVDALLNYSARRLSKETMQITGARALIDGVIRVRYAGDVAWTIENRLGPSASINCDPALISHVFVQLLDNAIKFQGEQPLHMVVDEVEADDGFIAISFADNGIGVEPEFADKIFEIFARLHNEDEYDGAGMGLSICHRVVCDHGGTILCDRSYQGGARFIVTLPRGAA